MLSSRTAGSEMLRIEAVQSPSNVSVRCLGGQHAKCAEVGLYIHRWCLCVHRAFWAQATAASPLLFTDTSLDHIYKKSRLKVIILIILPLYSTNLLCNLFFFTEAASDNNSIN